MTNYVLITAAAHVAAVVVAAFTAATADEDYENNNPEAVVASATVTKHNFAPPILCSLYHTRKSGFGYSAGKIFVKV